MIDSVYDCRSVQIPHGYAELLLADSAESCAVIKGLRRADYQAVTSARLHEVLRSRQACEAHETARTLHLLLKANMWSRKRYRYERVIMIRRGDSDDLTDTIAFFRRWFPRLLREGRLFVTQLPEGPIHEQGLAQALGSCEVVKAAG